MNRRVAALISGTTIGKVMVRPSTSPQTVSSTAMAATVGDRSTRPVQLARIELLRASWVTSARPSASSTGGTYMPKRPR